MEIPKEIKSFFDSEGRLKQWPGKMGKRLLVINFLADKFEAGKQYSDQELKDLLGEHHTFNDPVTLRRELIEAKVLDRTPDGRTYWKVEKEEPAQN